MTAQVHGQVHAYGGVQTIQSQQGLTRPIVTRQGINESPTALYSVPTPYEAGTLITSRHFPTPCTPLYGALTGL